MTVEDQQSDTGVGVPPAIMVVSLLNALAGLSLAAIGLEFDNSILIVVAIVGALVGSIAIPIAKAINRRAR
jgi:NAD/NADP transhydrogenase beta subunit